MAKITLRKFGARWCPPCQAMVRHQTLEKFAAKHPEVRIVVHDDSERGSSAFERLADEWNVKNLPTIVWLADGEELLRSNDTTLAGIEKQYERALRKAEK
jgi:thiol-disulfide isomerase/thioredoxin